MASIKLDTLFERAREWGRGQNLPVSQSHVGDHTL